MVEYNPFAPEVHYNPYPCWKRLRDEAPVYFNPEMNFYALSRYEDVLNAFLDPRTYISGEGISIDGADKGLGSMIQLDPPEHTVYRKLLSRVFTPKRVGELEPFIRGVAARYLDAVIDQDRFDVVQDFSLRLPMEVISELLGLPTELRDTVHDLSNRGVARGPDTTIEELQENLAFLSLHTDIPFDIARAVKELKAGRVEFKVDKTGIVHTTVGKASFPHDKLKENVLALMDVIVRAKPASSKGTYLKNIAISTTMGPGIKLDPNDLRVVTKA